MRLIQRTGGALRGIQAYLWSERLGYVEVHEDKVAGAAGHAEEVEDLVGAELFMPGIEYRQFQCIDHPADGVDDAAGKEPQETGQRQRFPQAAKDENADPAHGDVYERGKPFGAGDPDGFDQDTYSSDAPYYCKQCVADLTAEDDEADRCVGAGYEHEDHHVINLAEKLQPAAGQIHGVVGGTGTIQKNHACHKNGHSCHILPA